MGLNFTVIHQLPTNSQKLTISKCRNPQQTAARLQATPISAYILYIIPFSRPVPVPASLCMAASVKCHLHEADSKLSMIVGKFNCRDPPSLHFCENYCDTDGCRLWCLYHHHLAGGQHSLCSTLSGPSHISGTGTVYLVHCTRGSQTRHRPVLVDKKFQEWPEPAMDWPGKERKNWTCSNSTTNG